MKKIVLAPDGYRKVYAAQIDEILRAIGHPEALVTDKSFISDFSFVPHEGPSSQKAERMEAAVRALGVEFDSDTPIWKIAKMLFDGQNE
jgi:hypothetical protein